MADLGKSQWRGKGQAGFSRVQPIGAPPDGGEGSYAPLTFLGPIIAALGNTSLRVPTEASSGGPEFPALYGTVVRSAGQRTYYLILAVVSGDSSESYTLLRVNT